MVPVVQAEWDREWMKWRAEEIKKEAEIMKDVPGWSAGQSPYHNGRWAPPAYDLEGNPVRTLVAVSEVWLCLIPPPQ